MASESSVSPMAEKFSKYDAAEFLRTREEIRQFLEIVFEENRDDHVVIANAIGAAIRAHGVMIGTINDSES